MSCTPTICGGFENNRASNSVQSAHVVVAGNGSVNVQLDNVRDLATARQADRTFEVWIGQFWTPFGFAGPLGGLLGQIQTDARGNYSGPIVTPNGAFTFAGVIAPGEGPPFAIQFILSTPGERSELVAGITIGK